MKTMLLAAALALGLGAPVLAQQTAPAQQPTVAQKAGDVAGQVLNKLATPPAAPATGARAPAAAKPAAIAAKPALININKATPAELDVLPSIGEARSKAIVAGRPYKSVQELADRKILPKDSFETIKDKVAVK